ncbi:integrase arm-type DNA-binding domain-containing protein [Desulfovibrio sp. OttesenSCG-928-A18]|nr:integrase arm-type DNA-binding domain-containing protein [Desulfovibrio sp. OttesenSCG-928-A18]
MTLSDTAIRNAKPQSKPYKAYDADGLFIIVTPSGGKWWRFKYRFGGKEKLISLGTYPEVGLKEARRRRDEAREQIAAGVDPAAQRKAVRAAVRAEQADAFEVVALEWFTTKKDAWTEDHGGRVLARLKKDIFPAIGARPVREITPPELLAALRKVEQRGTPETAHRALQSCGQIFRYAIATGRADRDTADDLKGALVPIQKGRFATITEPQRIGALLRDLDAYEGQPIVRAALRLAPYVFVRPGELRRAEWAEFNFDAAEWRIPSRRMKMREMHIVPLARQVVEMLHDLHQYTGHTAFLFPSMRSNVTTISDMTLLAALRRMGYGKDEMTVHGFRAMASTLLNEQGYNRDWIERQLAHGERNSIRAAYNYAEYLQERRKMMQEWADYLDGLRKIKG